MAESEKPTELVVGEYVVDLGDERVYIDDQEPGGFFQDWDCLIISEHAIGPQPLDATSRALGALAEIFGGEAEWMLSALNDPLAHHDPKVRTDVSLRSLDSDLLAVQVKLGLYQYEDEEFEELIPTIVAPLLVSAGVELWKVHADPQDGGELCLILLPIIKRDWTTSDLVALGSDARALVSARRGGPIDLVSARHMLMAGHQRALIGLEEGAWLDAKAEPYDLDSVHGSYLLARLVSGFANTEGGLIVIPATTRKHAGREVIDKFKTLDLRKIDVTRIRDSIEEWVYPRISGLEIEVVGTSSSRGYLFIYIPKQPLSIWPAMVRRAEVAGKVRSEVAMVFERHGDQLRAIDTGRIHSLLSRARLVASISESSTPPGDGP